MDDEPRLNADGHYAIWKAASDAARSLDPRPRTKEEYAYWRHQDPRLPPEPETLYAIAWGTTGGWDGFLGRKGSRPAQTRRLASPPKPAPAAEPAPPVPETAPEPPKPEPVPKAAKPDPPPAKKPLPRDDVPQRTGTPQPPPARRTRTPSNQLSPEQRKTRGAWDAIFSDWDED